MNREDQQPPDKIQESQRPPGWQYEPGPGRGVPRSPVPPGGPYNVSMMPPPNPPVQPPVSPGYAEPMDMGTTLSFGQGMEYQYFEVPQPSQAMPQLRMERLQQLRQDRLRRDVQHARPDITTLIRRGKGRNSAPLTQNPSDAATSMPTKSNSVPLVNVPPVAVTAAAQPAQDTAMIKKVRIGRASAILMGAFVASRVLGLVRTSMFAATFGTGAASDAFIQASFLPDMIFNIIAGGALSSAFIPMFTKYMAGENNEHMAWRLANTALTLAVTIMVILAAIGALFAEPMIRLSSPGFSPDQIVLASNLVRIMFIQAIILGGGVIITSVLNAQQDFRLPAIGTVLYNVGNVLGLLPGLALAIAGHRNDNLAVYCAALGVVLGAGLNIGIQIPGLRKVGMYYKPDFNWRLPGIAQIGKQMLPRIFNASVLSVATFLDRYLIGLLGVVLVAGVTTDGLLTQYYQATQLLMLPLGIFGMAMSTAAFPTLTEYFAKKRLDRFRSVILETLRSILVLSIPSGIGLIILAEPIIQTLLAHGRFLPDNVTSMSIPLAFFAVGLAGLAAVEILTRSFYAMSDSKTPVQVSILQFAFKIALGLLFLNPFVLLGGPRWGPAWGMGALAFSTSISNLAEAVVLFIILDQRIGELLKPALLYFILRVLGASLCMGVVVFVSRILLDTLTSTVLHISSAGLVGFLVSAMKLVIELFAGTFVYLRSSRLFKIEELGPIRRLLDRFKLSWMM